jgi:tRNA1Val (adenine37-N6)-methyltransferase
MAGNSFVFKEFEVKQSNCAMKVGTDAVLLGAWGSLPEHGQTLDIGTGTGIIAMMAAQRSSTFIDAIEIDEEAYREALENCKNSKWGERINVHHISFQKFVPQALGLSKKYDVILSNPPYFSNCVQAASESRTMARHTCNLSFEELVDGIASLLMKDGSFATILPLKEAEDLSAIARRLGLYPNRIMRVKTTFTKPEKRILLQFGFCKSTPVEETLIIENEAEAGHLKTRSYSTDYKNLTRSFYLNF